MVPPAISYDEIADRAYALYVLRGGKHGHDLEDWLQAEREILEQENSTKEVMLPGDSASYRAMDRL